MKYLKIESAIQGCSCGREHLCPIEKAVVGAGAIQEIPKILTGYDRLLLVCDENTYRVCGSQVEALLRKAGKSVALQKFPDEGHYLIPNEAALDILKKRMEERPQALVGVGSGVINDLCKQTSFAYSLPYMIVGTAPSMDGFASVGAALILKGMKVTLNARPPRWIVGDSDVLKEAPLDMICSGAGDILGKLSCLNDWKISQIINGEYFCQRIYDEVMTEVKHCQADIALYRQRDAEAIERLMGSLIQVGVDMAYVGNSRPASGSEHHLSHFYEIVGILRGHTYLPHGTDVAYGTLVTATLREMLLHVPEPKRPAPRNRAEWERNIHAVYGRLADEIIALQDKVGFYDTDRFPAIQKNWSAICSVLREMPGSAEIQGMLAQLGMKPERYWATYGPEMVQQSIVYAKDLKDRYTLLWLLNDLGLLEPFAARLISLQNA